MHLDAGCPKVFGMVAELVACTLEKGDFSLDAKTELLEISTSRFGREPSYRVVGEEGPAHERIFEVEVAVSAGVKGRGSGGSKKEAVRFAAGNALGGLGY